MAGHSIAWYILALPLTSSCAPASAPSRLNVCSFQLFQTDQMFVPFLTRLTALYDLACTIFVFSFFNLPFLGSVDSAAGDLE